MKKLLFLAILAILAVSFGTMGYAQQITEVETTTVYTESSSPFDGRLKLQGYAEYINFTGSDIEGNTWGGGVLARYLFLDWLGAQTNVTFYADCEEEKLGGDLGFVNWRLSLILHAYVPDIADPLYVYGGGGLGVQFNDDVGDVEVDNAFTGHVLAGIGYDITELLNVEAEVGYQFGSADLSNYTDDDAGVEAVFVRLGGGVRF